MSGGIYKIFLFFDQNDLSQPYGNNNVYAPEAFHGTFVAGITLAIIIAGVLAAAVVALVVIWPTLSAAVLAAAAAISIPLGWILVIVGAVVLAVALLYTAWKHNWGGIRDKTKAALYFIRDVISRITGWIQKRWAVLVGILGDKNTTLYEKAKLVWGWMKDSLEDITNAIKREAIKAWEYIKDQIPILMEKMKIKLGQIWDTIKINAEMYDNVVAKFQGMIDELKKTIKYFTDNPVVEFIKKATSSFKSSGGTSFYNSSGSSIDSYKAARKKAGTYADGGHMYAGELGIVGEEGPEYFRPDVSGTILPNYKMGDQKGGPTATSSARPINIKLDLKLDGRTVWESVRKYSAAEIRRLGG